MALSGAPPNVRLMKKLLVSLVCLAFFAVNAAARDLVIHAGNLIDGVGEAPRSKVSILIHDDRISAVEPGFVNPAGAEIIDLSGATVMPGFIDCHVHIAPKLPSRTNATENWLTHSDLDRAFDGAVFCRANASAGLHRRAQRRRWRRHRGGAECHRRGQDSRAVSLGFARAARTDRGPRRSAQRP